MPNGDDKRGWDKMSWAAWKGEASKAIDTIEKNQDTLFELVRQLTVDVIVLKTKAALYGTAGGTLAGGLAVVAKHVMAK